MVAEHVDEEMPSISGFEFWGATVVPGKTVKCEVTGNILHVTSISMDEHIANDPKQRSVLSVIVDGKQFVLASLREGVCEQIAVDFLFRENKPVKFKVSGKTTLHLVGYLQPLDLGFDDEEIYSDEDDECDSDCDSDHSGSEDEEMGGSSDEEMVAAEETGGKKRQADIPAAVTEDKATKKSKKADAAPQSQKSEPKPEAIKASEPAAKEIDAPKAPTPVVAEPAVEAMAVESPEPVKQQPEAAKDAEPKSKKNKKEKKEAAKKAAESKPEAEPKPVKEVEPKPEKEVQPQPKKEAESKKAEANAFRKLLGGVLVKDSHVGEGKLASKGKRLGVVYKGMLKNGKVFDSNMDSSKPFFFKMGHGDVIRGWDVGFEGMKVGGKRMIVCPPKMAYGKEGSPPEIPPNSVLVFEVELVNVK